MTVTYILGGAQTDFARNASRENDDLVSLLRAATRDALTDAAIDAADVQSAHVANFAAEIYSGQGHLGGLLVEAIPEFDGLAITRHEAACASGSVAVLAATAAIEAGRADVAVVTGVELMRAGGGFAAQQGLGAAAWVPTELEGVDYPWPSLFSEVADEYEHRYGLDIEALRVLSERMFANAQRNPDAQTRTWSTGEGFFAADDETNPVVAGRLRRSDCSQVTDGAAAIVLASPEYAQHWARSRGKELSEVARIDGWGHRVARMKMRHKLVASRGDEYVFPHVAATVRDAYKRAGIDGAAQLDGAEVHDCFTISAYAAIDHLGFTAPGESWKAVETAPINPSGGLIGLGHPVGATGVRMLRDAARQVEGRAGDMQIEGAQRMATLNIGGSTTTTACFVVSRGETR